MTRRGRTLAVNAVVIGVLLAVAGVVVYRVLAPAEVVTITDTGVPGPAQARPGVIGSLAAAPLIVDGRVRVYAAKRQIRADGPVDFHTQLSPLWSYRRWPAQVVGVVTAGSTVVSRWSDGRLVAIDALSGRVAWRADGPPPATRQYTGRRTGAQTVYAPAGLFTAANRGQPVVLVSAAGEANGYDATSGRRLWRTVFPAAPPDCRVGGLTTSGGRFVVLDRCTPTFEFYAVATGRLATRWRPPAGASGAEPVGLGCALGRSACAAMRVHADGATQGWLLDGPAPVRAPALDPSTVVLAGEVAVDAPERGAAVTGRAARTNNPLWTLQVEPTAAVAAEPGAVHVLTRDKWLVTVDPTTGAELSRFPLVYPREPDDLDWRPGYVHALNRFVLVERLAVDAPGDARAADSDDEYYPIDQPVLLTGA